MNSAIADMFALGISVRNRTECQPWLSCITRQCDITDQYPKGCIFQRILGEFGFPFKMTFLASSKYWRYHHDLRGEYTILLFPFDDE